MTGGQFMTYKISEVCAKISIMSNIYAMPESGIIENRLSEAARTWQFPAKKRYNGGNCKTFCHPPMLVLKNVILKSGSQVTRRRFTDISGLIREVYASLVESLENRGALATRAFDDSLCSGATLKDIANEQGNVLCRDRRGKGAPGAQGFPRSEGSVAELQPAAGQQTHQCGDAAFRKEPPAIFQQRPGSLFPFPWGGETEAHRLAAAL
jgi:hypothetical protein